ncbi:MAG: CYTH domain-containing protein [Muribaculum sp.]|nr:CYTH domain-containing protein [Muribaculum sp.]
MAKEIERKFLVRNDSFKALASDAVRIRQGYLSTDKRAVVRVRIKGEQAFLTVKGENVGAVRDEWEYSIPKNDATDMLSRLSVGVVVDKTRYIVEFGGNVWEIDEFHSPVKGLTVAEIELRNDNQSFAIPPFVGEEVTGDPRYYNSNIARFGSLTDI